MTYERSQHREEGVRHGFCGSAECKRLAGKVIELLEQQGITERDSLRLRRWLAQDRPYTIAEGRAIDDMKLKYMVRKSRSI